MCGYSCAIIGVLKNDFDGIFVNLDMTTTERVINSRSKGFILRLPHVLISKPISQFSLHSVLDSFFSTYNTTRHAHTTGVFGEAELSSGISDTVFLSNN